MDVVSAKIVAIETVFTSARRIARIIYTSRPQLERFNRNERSKIECFADASPCDSCRVIYAVGIRRTRYYFSQNKYSSRSAENGSTAGNYRPNDRFVHYSARCDRSIRFGRAHFYIVLGRVLIRNCVWALRVADDRARCYAPMPIVPRPNDRCTYGGEPDRWKETDESARGGEGIGEMCGNRIGNTKRECM